MGFKLKIYAELKAEYPEFEPPKHGWEALHVNSTDQQCLILLNPSQKSLELG